MDITLIARGGVPVKLDRDRILFFDKTATWLLMQRYGTNVLPALFKPGSGKDAAPEVRDMDTLVYFLWAGLQREAADTGEELTIEKAEEFMRPTTVSRIFTAVLLAITRGIETPPLPGKETAAPESPAAAVASGAKMPTGPGKARASTLRTRSASPSRSSGKPRASSGRPR